jgi:hypothetical protein
MADKNSRAVYRKGTRAGNLFRERRGADGAEANINTQIS